MTRLSERPAVAYLFEDGAITMTDDRVEALIQHAWKVGFQAGMKRMPEVMLESLADWPDRRKVSVRDLREMFRTMIADVQEVIDKREAGS